MMDPIIHRFTYLMETCDFVTALEQIVQEYDLSLIEQSELITLYESLERSV